MWVMVEMVGLASFYTYLVPAKEGEEVVKMLVKLPRKDGVKAGSKWEPLFSAHCKDDVRSYKSSYKSWYEMWAYGLYFLFFEYQMLW